MKKGRIFIVSAPSGSGKTTICKAILKKRSDILPSVSMTTRRPRRDEKDKKDYHYVSEEHFKKEIKNGNLLEWEENFGYLYGTPKDFVLNKIQGGKNVLLSIDVKGAMQIRRAFPDSVLIFIKPPSEKELSRRLNTRNTDQKKDIKTRLKIAKKELEFTEHYDYIVVNEKLEDAVCEVLEIIKKEG